MENFVVSARKYRPASFETVIGQEHVVKTLKNAIKNHHVAHAFLFCGPRGVGKTTSARLLAKTINCTNLSAEIEACNQCDSCLAFNKNASFNIYELDAASNNSVEDIRALVEQVRYAPQGAAYKIYIIDEVHMLSPAAFNAFLKTLEEPPPYAKFILATTEKHKILPTILSRCQVFDFHRIKIEDAVKQLKVICEKENITAEEEALHVIALKADGAMRDALSIFDRIVTFSGSHITYNDVISNLNVLDYDYFFKATNLVNGGNIAGILLLFDEILSNGFDAQHFLSGFAEHFRNLMVCKFPDTFKLLEVSATVAGKYTQQAQACTASFLLNGLNLLNQFELNYKASNNQRLHVELALMKLANLNHVLQLNTQQPDVEAKKKSNNLTEIKPMVENHGFTVKPEMQQVVDPTTSITNTPAVQLDLKTKSPSDRLEKLKQRIAQQLIDNQQKQANTTAIEEIGVELQNDFNKEELMKVWQEYLAHLDASSKTRVSSFLRESRIDLSENFQIKLEVRSNLEMQLLEEERLEMLPFFRKRLNNGQVDFQISVNEELIQVSKKVSKQEQLKIITDSNPAVANLVYTLGLEIDY
jgi:DNA polymerase-3 subunit gamma/tau